MKYNLSILVIFLYALTSCNKDEDKITTPEAITLKVEKIKSEGVWVTGKIKAPENTIISDYGFVYYLSDYYQKDFNETLMDKVSLGGTLENNFKFSGVLNKNLIRDRTFTVKSYLNVDNQISYGEELEFVSLYGEINSLISLKPNTASIGDTIAIKGKYLNSNYIPIVIFDEIETKPILISDTLITVKVPDGLQRHKFPIQLYVANRRISINQSFKLIAPKIDSISDTQVLSGKHIELYGNNLDIVKKVYIDDINVNKYNYKFSIESKNKLKIRIPEKITQGNVSVSFEYLDTKVDYPDLLKSILPKIESFSPDTIWFNDTLTIKGQNLDYITYINSPSILPSYGKILQQTDSLIEILIQRKTYSEKIHSYYGDLSIYSDKKLQWRPPLIDSLSKNTLYDGEEYTIYGKYFISDMLVLIDGNNQFAQIQNDSILTLGNYSQKAGKSQITFKHSGCFDVETGKYIDAIPIEIVDINPKTIRRGDSLSIKTNNLYKNQSPRFEINGVKFRSNPSTEEANVHKVIYNDQLFTGDQLSIRMKSASQTCEYNGQINFNDPWSYVSTSGISLISSFAFLNDNYFAFNSQYKLSKFNANNEDWDEVSDIRNSDAPKKLLSYNDKLIYTVDDQNNSTTEIYSYSIDTKEYVKEAVYTYEEKPYYKAFSYIIGTKIYLGNHLKHVAYDFESKLWEEKQSLPIDFYDSYQDLSFRQNKKFYILSKKDINGKNQYSKIWVYDSVTDEWNQENDFKTGIVNDPAIYTQNNETYLMGSSGFKSKKFWIFNGQNKSWKEYLPPPSSGKYRVFIQNGFIYISNSNFDLGLPNGSTNYKMRLDEIVPISK